MKQNLVLLFFIFIALATSAQTKPNSTKPVRFLLGVALDFGGDDLGIVYFTDALHKPLIQDKVEHSLTAWGKMQNSHLYQCR